jgi:hypothetical protein
MTPVQCQEVKRMTVAMWAALGYVARAGEHAEVGGNAGWMQSINILARRGFCTLRPVEDGYHRIELTKAGAEALSQRAP